MTQVWLWHIAQISTRDAMQEHSRRTIPKYLGLGTVTTFLLGTNTLVFQSQPTPLLKWEQAKVFALKTPSVPQYIFYKSMALKRQAVTATNLIPMPPFPDHALRQTQFLKQRGLLVMSSLLHISEIKYPSQLHRLLWLMSVTLLIASHLINCSKKE